jgi:hypothetical protein
MSLSRSVDVPVELCCSLVPEYVPVLLRGEVELLELSGLVDDVLGEVLEVLGGVVALLELYGLVDDVLEVDELLELYGLVLDEDPVVTRETVRWSPLPWYSTVTCVPAVSPAGTSEVPETTMNV